MEQKQLEYFREILTERFQELLAEAEKTVTGMT